MTSDGHRCRLCTAHDADALVEHVGEQLWESRRHGTLDDWPWAEAGRYWQRIYRELATTAVVALPGDTRQLVGQAGEIRSLERVGAVALLAAPWSGSR